LLAAALLAGCGSRGVTVQGRLEMNGAPYRPAAGETVVVTFLAGAGGKAVSYPASVSAEGTFTVGGPEGKGIPPGRYRVAVSATTYGSGSGDRFGGTFGPADTPLACEVTAGTKEITVDLGKKTAS
jgi:hypothetical protein